MMYKSFSIVSIKITIMVHIIRQIIIIHTSSFATIKRITRKIIVTVYRIIRFNSTSNPSLFFKINTNWEVA